MTATPTTVDAATAVRTGFEAFARGDLEAFAAVFAEDSTWNHRNDDTLGGVHRGIDAIIAFLNESGRLTAGTLRAVPGTVMTDGGSHVAVVTRVSGTRPDGRSFDDEQIVHFVVTDGLIRSADQYIGDPTAVTAFWA
ncbi:MAG TPA: nuclear transport factor 2 family protein [Actinomycetes bacterium]|nr:nuclear transport factor 2 family protein [Actinomycetes bacterium]